MCSCNSIIFSFKIFIKHPLCWFAFRDFKVNDNGDVFSKLFSSVMTYCSLSFKHMLTTRMISEKVIKEMVRDLLFLSCDIFSSQTIRQRIQKTQHTAHFYVMTTIIIILMQSHYLPSVLCLAKIDFLHSSFGHLRQISYLFPSV